MERRSLLRAVGAGALSAAGLGACSPRSDSGDQGRRPFVPPGGPRSRVLYVNDLSGDIDGLFATVHFLLSPSIDLRGIVGTGPGEYDPAGENAETAAQRAAEIISMMGLNSISVHQGIAGKFSPAQPNRAAGVEAIIQEAMRTDTQLPLYVAVGGGLSEVAAALALEPSIADRFTLAWIGGGRPHPEGVRYEPNFGIDPVAAQYVFNESRAPIWHVPSEVYQTCIVSTTELQVHVAPCGRIGAWLYDAVVQRGEMYKPAFNPGETWTLGDNPLVVLTGLNDWVPSSRESDAGPFEYQRTGSSTYDEMVAPRLNELGVAVPQSGGRAIRRYRSVDTRLMFGDFFAKLRANYA